MVLRSASSVVPGPSNVSTRSLADVALAISSAVWRARRSGLVSTRTGGSSCRESVSATRAGFCLPARRERARLVRLACVRVRVANEKDEHATSIVPAAHRLGWQRAKAPLRRRRRLHGPPAHRQPARRVHRRARRRRGDDAGARARDGVLRDRLRAPRGGRRGRADPHLHAEGRAAVCGPPGPRHRIRPRVSAAAVRHRPRDRSRRRARAARAGRERRHRLRPDDAAGADRGAVRRSRRALRRTRRRRLDASRRAVRQRRAAHLRRARFAGGGRCAPPGLRGARSSSE